MAVIDKSMFVGNVVFVYVDENPEIVPVDVNAGSIIVYQQSETLPAVLYAKTANGENTSVFRLVTRSEYSSIVDPAVTDDITKGYGVGSSWFNTATRKLYRCVSAVPGAADWILLN